jgi:RNA ligase (TIGR02306 family)
MLASIQKIIDIQPIENANAIEKAYVLGWQVVAKKGEFKVGDMVVYIQIDTVVPDKPEFAFLAKEKFRIKTIKLRGTLSQGIIFPLSILPVEPYVKGETEQTHTISLARDWKEGDDVSKVLEVTHYEKPVPGGFNQGDTKGSFPRLFPKTDEERIQNVPEVLNELRGKSYYISTKCDGTSCTIYFNRGKFGVCSRNMEKKDSEGSVYWQMARKYDLEKKMREWGANIAIQGEICGPGIQKNKLGLTEYTLFVFDVYDIDDGKYLPVSRMFQLVTMFDLNRVPLVQMGEGFLYNQEQLLEMAKGKYIGTENDREGIVVRAMNGDFSEKLRNRISFKVLNNDFLLKEKE